MKKIIGILVVLLASTLFTGCGKDNCGNGVKDAGEFCDPKIPQGSPGACPTACKGGITFTQSLADQCKDPCPVPPVRPVGSDCTNDIECGKKGICLKEGNTPFGSPFKSGYCSTVCKSDSDCASGSICIIVANGAGLCLSKCDNPKVPLKKQNCSKENSFCYPTNDPSSGICLGEDKPDCDPSNDECNKPYENNDKYCDPAKSGCIIKKCEKDAYDVPHCVMKPGSTYDEAKKHGHLCRDIGQCSGDEKTTICFRPAGLNPKTKEIAISTEGLCTSTCQNDADCESYLTGTKCTAIGVCLLPCDPSSDEAAADASCRTAFNDHTKKVGCATFSSTTGEKFSYCTRVVTQN